MKTLILYATKHGAAREIANRIAKRMGGAVLHDLGQGNIPDLAGFDCVIIGSAVYVGAVKKEAKAFLESGKDILLRKKLGLFVSGLQEEAAEEILANNFPPELRQAARAVSFLGGVFDPKKAGVLERLAVKAAAKITAYTDTVSDKRIEQFAEAMTACQP